MATTPQFPHGFLQSSFEVPLHGDYHEEGVEQPPFKKPRLSSPSQQDNHHHHHCFGPITNPTSMLPPQQQQQQTLMMVNPPQNLNSRSAMLFFKTRLCKSFIHHGYCNKGDGCGFAHGHAELRQAPPNWQEIIANSNSNKFGNSQNNQLCSGYEGCVQYHDRDNITPAAKEFSGYPGHGEQQQMVVVGGGNTVKVGCHGSSRSAFWKTKLCFKFNNTGYCSYGDNCHYAHGEAELRKVGGNMLVDSANFEGGPSKPLREPGSPHASSTQMQPTCVQQQTHQGDKSSEFTVPINTCAQQTHQDKKPLEWKGPKRISRIYGDWIDC